MFVAFEVDMMAGDVELVGRRRITSWETSPAFCRRRGERRRHNGCCVKVHNGFVLGVLQGHRVEVTSYFHRHWTPYPWVGASEEAKLLRSE